MFSTPRRRAFVLFLFGATTAALVFLSIYAVDRIGDCTTPGGNCYERQARQTERVVNVINLSTVFTAACALDGVRGDAAMLRCVERRIERHMRSSR